MESQPKVMPGEIARPKHCNAYGSPLEGYGVMNPLGVILLEQHKTMPHWVAELVALWQTVHPRKDINKAILWLYNEWNVAFVNYEWVLLEKSILR